MDENILGGAGASSAVPRSGLMRRLGEGAAARIVFVEAPAGFGKTVSVRLWLAKRPAQVRWISLDRFDDAPAPFYQQLCAAVDGCEPRGAGAPASLASFSASPIEHAMMTARTVPEDGEEVLIVLDDFHCIENRDLVQSLPYFIRRLPYRYRFVFLSRAALPAELIDDQAGAGEVLAVQADDLLFSAEEIKSLFATRGRTLSSEEAENLREATGGWAFAVAAIAAGDVPVRNGRPNEATIAPFLTAHVWDALDDRMRETLLSVSVVESFTPELFGRLTGCRDAQGAIDDIMKRGLFLSCNGDGRYRFHAMFLDYLQQRAAEQGLDTKRLYRIAARYYREQSDSYAVRRYAVLGDDMRLLKTQILDGMQYGAVENNRSIAACVDEFRRSLGILPAEAYERYPFLNISLAWYRYLTGDRPGTEAALDALQAGMKKIAFRYPRFLQPAIVVSLLDPRTTLVSLAERIEKLPKLPGRSRKQQTASISANLPFAHRCLRDFSELSLLSSFDELERTVGAVFSDYFAAAMMACRAGFAYERGDFEGADELAVLTDRTYLDSSSSEEALFVFHSLRMSAAFAAGDDAAVAREAEAIERVIVDKEAQFLEPNYLALRTDQALRSGDAEAAETWLSHYFVHDDGRLMLFRIATYLTTVRAYLALGRNDEAIDLAARVAELARSFSRVLDEAEACTLGAVAQYRAGDLGATDALFDRAVSLLEPYGFVSTIGMEGCASAPLIKRAKARRMREASKEVLAGETHADGIDGDPSADAEDARLRYLNRVSIAAQEQVSRRSGLPGAKTAKLKLSKQQARMIELLARGCTNAEIVEITGLSLSTVKTHTSHAYRKLGVHTMQDAVLEARRRGLIE